MSKLGRSVCLFVFAAGVAAGAPARAGHGFKDGFYVKRGATAEAMLNDRDFCEREASHVGTDQAYDYSDPQYGALSALGTAIDQDALHFGTAKKLQELVVGLCMTKRGWTKVEPSRDELKRLSGASLRKPEALDVWLKANEPSADAPAAAPAASTPAPDSASPGATTAPGPH